MLHPYLGAAQVVPIRSEIVAREVRQQGEAPDCRGSLLCLLATHIRLSFRLAAASLLGAAAGKPVTCVDVTVDQLRQALAGHGMPEVVAAATAELLGQMATGTAAYVSSDVEALLGRAPRDFAQWTRDNAQAFR